MYGAGSRPPPSDELVRAAREMVERYEARQHGLRDLHPDDREAFDEAIDALRRALDAGDATEFARDGRCTSRRV